MSNYIKAANGTDSVSAKLDVEESFARSGGPGGSKRKQKFQTRR